MDGEFLLELREEDLAQALGMEHKLHVRKVILARDKLRPLGTPKFATDTEREDVDHPHGGR